MELSELKTAWKKVADRSADENRLEEDQLREILSSRGNGIISRLDRNVKIGFGLLALFILLTFIDKLLPNSMLNNLSHRHGSLFQDGSLVFSLPLPLFHLHGNITVSGSHTSQPNIYPLHSPSC